MLKILIIDNHKLFRELLIPILEDLDPGVIVYEADSIYQSLKLLNVVKPIDLLLLDLRFPHEHSWDDFPFDKTASDHIPVLILTESTNINDFNMAVKKGCKGYITKSTSKRQLINGINLVLAGHSYYSTDMMSVESSSGQSASAAENDSPVVIESLSKRQNEILNHLIEGNTNRKIAKLCGISEGTVKLHVSGILKTLCVSNRTQAVIMANKIKASRSE